MFVVISRYHRIETVASGVDKLFVADMKTSASCFPQLPDSEFQ